MFDAQVAFTMLERFGTGSSYELQSARKRVRAEIKGCLGSEITLPAVQVVHAPVFYGTTFSAWSEIDGGANSQAILEVCKNAGFRVDEEAGTSNVSVAGENFIHLAAPEPDPARAGTWWFWGAADKIRLPAWNAVQLAEKLAG